MQKHLMNNNWPYNSAYTIIDLSEKMFHKSFVVEVKGQSNNSNVSVV